jgi:5,10-methylenetetrahydromethanopterin reductase
VDIDIIVEPDLTPAQLSEIGVAAERYGVRALWSSNYYAHWDAFLSLLPLAQATDRLLIGPLAVSPFEMHPMKIANSILTLNEMSNGRALIAIGAGEGVTDAIVAQKPKRIVLAVREAIEIVAFAASRNLAQGYQGEIFQVAFPCPLDWVRSPAPPVYAAAYGPQMMRMGGRLADGVFFGDLPIPKVDDAINNVRTGQAKRDKPRQDFRITNFFGWHIKQDRDAAYREARREIVWRGKHLSDDYIAPFLNKVERQIVRDNMDAFRQAWFTRTGEIKGVPDDIVNRLIGGMTSTGDLSDLDREIERYRAFEKAGLTEIALRLHDEPMEGLKIIGEHVLPALR